MSPLYYNRQRRRAHISRARATKPWFRITITPQEIGAQVLVTRRLVAADVASIPVLVGGMLERAAMPVSRITAARMEVVHTSEMATRSHDALKRFLAGPAWTTPLPNPYDIYAGGDSWDE